MPDPAIVADDHPVAAALGKEVAVARGRRLVIFRAIGEAMLRRPAHRMVRRADPDRIGDRRELPDLGVGDLAILPEIGVVAERGIFDACIAQDFATPAEVASRSRTVSWTIVSAILGRCDASMNRLPR